MAFRDIPQPTNYQERCALATKTEEEFQLGLPILVDSMDDASRALFGNLPHCAVVIGADGNVLEKLPWADPDTLMTIAQGGDPDEPEQPNTQTKASTPFSASTLVARAIASGDLREIQAVTLADATLANATAAERHALTALLSIHRTRLVPAAQRERTGQDALAAIMTAWPEPTRRRAAALAQLADWTAGTPLQPRILMELSRLPHPDCRQAQWADAELERLR